MRTTPPPPAPIVKMACVAARVVPSPPAEVHGALYYRPAVVASIACSHRLYGALTVCCCAPARVVTWMLRCRTCRLPRPCRLSRPVHARYGLEFINCSNVTFRGFSSDTLTSPNSQASVVSVGGGGSCGGGRTCGASIVVDVEEGFPLPVGTSSVLFNQTCPYGNGVCGEIKTIYWDPKTRRMWPGACESCACCVHPHHTCLRARACAACCVLACWLVVRFAYHVSCIVWCLDHLLIPPYQQQQQQHRLCRCGTPPPTPLVPVERRHPLEMRF